MAAIILPERIAVQGIGFADPLNIATRGFINSLLVGDVIRPSGIASTLQFGTAQLNQNIDLIGKPSTLAFGTHILGVPILVLGKPSTLQFGTAELIDFVIRPLGKASELAFGSIQFNLNIDFAGKPSTLAFGVPEFILFAPFVPPLVIPLPGNVHVIEVDERVEDGIYILEPQQICSFRFEIPLDGIVSTFANHMLLLKPRQSSHVNVTDPRLRQSFGIRAWISDDPVNPEEFFRFHIGTGGVGHRFYDKRLNPPPLPRTARGPRRNRSGGNYTFRDHLVPLEFGTYYYNVQNLVNFKNRFRILFTGGTELTFFG